MATFSLHGIPVSRGIAIGRLSPDLRKYNLAKLADIMAEVERQANSLKRQASKARKYRALGAAVRLGTGEAQNWADAAGDAFYDQAHFIRDFRELAGCPPGQHLIRRSALTGFFTGNRPIGR